MSTTYGTPEAALKDAESISRKYRRAQRNLELAIKDLSAAGYNTVELEANLEEVIQYRNDARVVREAARLKLAQERAQQH